MSSCKFNSTNSSIEIITTPEIIRNSFSVLAVFFLLVGIVFLVRLGSHRNQNLIIINLAVIEMISCLNIPRLSKLKGMRIPFMSIKVFSNLAVRMFMLLLLGDRFLAIFLNIKYPVIITRGKIVKMSSLIWIISCLYGIMQATFAAFGDPKTALIRLHRSWFIHNYIIVVFDSIFIVSSIVTYIYFYFKFKGNLLKDASQKSNESLKSNRRRAFNYKIPFMIVGTFWTFNVTSDILYQVEVYHVRNARCCTHCELLVNIASFLQISGYISDAILYIAMQRRVTRMLKRK